MEALASAGYPILHEQVNNGCLVVDSGVRHGSGRLGVQVMFSPEHPFVAPIVVGAQRVLERHQQPLTRNFCLDSPDRQWWNPDHTAADLLGHLERLLDADVQDEISSTEADMTEPISGMLRTSEPGAVIVGGPMLADALPYTCGRLTLAHSPREPQLWAVEQIEAGGQTHPVIDRGGLSGIGIASQIARVRVPFRVIDAPQGAAGFDVVQQALAALVTESASAHAARRRKKANHITIWAAVTYLEEGPRRGERQRSWSFCRMEINLHNGEQTPSHPRAQALDLGVRQRRTPELRGMEAMRFLVVGAGSVGGHVICDLARASAGRLDIVDGDVYDLNNSVRHVLPVSAAGRNKAEAMREAAQLCNPHCEVHAHPWNIGTGERVRRTLVGLVSMADVVIDATGSHDITRLLQWRCATLGMRPLVSAALTPGGYGGRVVMLRDHSPCFDCFLSDPEIPRPAEGPNDNVTPYGCSHPAASCAGFDVAQLAAITARAAARAVRHIAYPSLDFDWAIVNFRPGHVPWTQGHLTAQSSCSGCAR